MDSFGQKLREAIESRGLSLEYVARATGLDIAHLRALERDDLGALPEDESVTEGLQAIARLVDVEPDEVVNDFLRERQQHRRAAVVQLDDEFVHDAQQRADVMIREPATGWPRVPGLFLLGALTLILAAAGFLWLRSPGADGTAPATLVSGDQAPVAAAEQVSRSDEPIPQGAPSGTGEAQSAPVGEMESASAREMAPVARTDASAAQARPPAGNTPVANGNSRDAASGLSEPSTPPAPGATAPATGNAGTATPARPVASAQLASPTAAPSGLSIPQHGVGTWVVNHELIGEADRFAEGTRVWYWTWVQGATAGQTINHVWLHEGQEMLSVPLKLGGERWRTHSYKNLHWGLTGQWRVEARDESGRVLAYRDFQCF